MQFSKFGKKFTQNSGILQLMDDLGNALNSDTPVIMLGGGNPASIPAVNTIYQDSLNQITKDTTALDSAANYANPKGDTAFIKALAHYFNTHHGLPITAENIALTNGSQNAFFYLFNLFGGAFDTGEKSILLPLSPEYIGYADAHIEGKHFISLAPKIETVEHEGETGFFKYRVDFDAINALPELKNGHIGAICVSRPTNPTGNVLTDDEMAQLDAIAQAHGIPLIIDNAYGMPFPAIIHTDATLTWHENIVLCFSLSKIGLAGVRTGIVIAHPDIIKAIESLNAIINLAPTRFGAAIVSPLLKDDRLGTLCETHIRPFYAKQSALAIKALKTTFKDFPQVKIHKPEGAIFLWLWFENLPISTTELYQILKEQGVLIIPSEHFFIGLDTKHFRHARECIRLSIAQDEATITQGIDIIGKVVKALYHKAT